MGKSVGRLGILGTFIAALVLAAPVMAQGDSVKEVIIVSKTHFDIGYTARVAEVLNRYRTTMMDGALSVMEETSSLPKAFQFAWTLPGWPLAQIVGPEQTPERREKILAAMRSGRIVWHALPFTMHTESLELEDLVRGLHFSSALSRQLGQQLPTDAKMTDVTSHSWVLPTLLTHAGVTFLHIGCNPACQSPRVPTLFWWEGPDGSRLLTFYSAGNYGTGLLPPENWPYKTWLAMLMTGDNQGPPTLKEAETLRREASDKLPSVNVHFGKMSDFAEAILSEHPDLPVVRGDVPDTWIHGLESMPIESALVRQWRPQVTALEGLNTLLECWGVPTASVSGTLSSAYENSLLYGEHTWGSCGTKPGPFRYGEDWKRARADGVYKGFEASFEDHRAYSHKVATLAEPAIAERMAALAAAVSVSGQRIVLYNPLPWVRDALVEWKQEKPAASALRDSDSGRTEPVTRDGDLLRFVARALPPMGYKTYIPADKSDDSKEMALNVEKGILENGIFRVTVDPERGGVRSVIEKRTGRELVNQSSPLLLGQYLYERFGREQTQDFGRKYITRPELQWAWDDLTKVNLPEGEYRSALPNKCQVTYAGNDVTVSATMTAAPQGILTDRVRMTVRLYKGLPFVELAWSTENKTGDPWPEAGWVCLPINADKPTFKLSRVGSVVDPVKDIVAGSNRHVFCLNAGLTVTDKHGGTVGICPMDSPLVSLGTPGLWQYSLDYTPDKADVFVNVFNNQWSTNFPLWVEGTWTSRVRLWAADSDDSTEALLTPGWNTRTPCWAGVADGPAGSLPTSGAGLSLSRSGVLVTTFGDNPDGPGRILRVWEQAGVAGDCTITLPKGFKAEGARQVDLRGQTCEGPVQVNGTEVTVPLKAYAPCTLLFPE